MVGGDSSGAKSGEVSAKPDSERGQLLQTPLSRPPRLFLAGALYEENPTKQKPTGVSSGPVRAQCTRRRITADMGRSVFVSPPRPPSPRLKPRRRAWDSSISIWGGTHQTPVKIKTPPQHPAAPRRCHCFCRCAGSSAGHIHTRARQKSPTPGRDTTQLPKGPLPVACGEGQRQPSTGIAVSSQQLWRCITAPAIRNRNGPPCKPHLESGALRLDVHFECEG